MGETQYAERLKAMATPPPGEPDTIEHEAIRWAIAQIEAARTPGPATERVVAIMREESGTYRRAASDGENGVSGLAYWLKRAAENMRRYAGWIEAARTPGPDVSGLLEAAKELIAADDHPDTTVWLEAYDRFRLIVEAATKGAGDERRDQPRELHGPVPHDHAAPGRQ